MKNFVICSAAYALLIFLISCSSAGDPRPPFLRDLAEDCDGGPCVTFDAAFLR